ncbi:camp-binding domain-like protein [Anaeromyces robustus]|uniref:Camp-binding domain-like protein n=1 Tax=Anaeromyces robustus TaxID=1754192 RepID=A0A1Y1VPG5_9FUNG|nr:camp-binding domain-like protein [Anaeromyces robustus]|eukprot:ORX62491.1 camp-binding domain-like protein [Anaeromyces robustus]
MNHIVNEYKNLNKNFKKIQKEFNVILNSQNDNRIDNPYEKQNDSAINDNKKLEPIPLSIKILPKSLFIENLPNNLISILNEKVEEIFIEEGQNIITKNDYDKYMYFLLSGEAYVCDFFENKIAKMFQDNWFGFFSLLGKKMDKKRTADIKATTDCTLYRISVEDIEEVLKMDKNSYSQFENFQNQFTEIYNEFNNIRSNSICYFKNEFLIELAYDILVKIPIFENIERKFLFDLILHMIPKVVSRGKIIISRDDEPDCLYCVLNGTVEVFSHPDNNNNNDNDNNNKDYNDEDVLVHAEMSSGSFFGEIGLLLGMRRTSSIRIKEKSFLLKITKDILTTISNKYPNVKIGINKRTSGCILALQENNDNKSPLEQFDLEVNCQNLRKIKLFNNFDNNTLEEIAMGMTRESYQPNEFIIKCGDNAESMFFLTHGTIEVISENNKVIDIAKGPNVYFGEVALLEDVPRIASIKAKSYCSVFVLTKKTLLSVLKKNSQFEAEIEKTSRERLQAHLMRSILA